MSSGQTLGALSGLDTGHAARWRELEKLRPDAMVTCRPGHGWTGSLVVCRKRLHITCPSLGRLLDALDGLAALDVEAVAIEQDFPGWRLWLSSVDRWWAVRQGPDGIWRRQPGPITVTADDLAALRSQLEDAAELAAAGAARHADTV